MCKLNNTILKPWDTLETYGKENIHETMNYILNIYYNNCLFSIYILH